MSFKSAPVAAKPLSQLSHSESTEAQRQPASVPQEDKGHARKLRAELGDISSSALAVTSLVSSLGGGSLPPRGAVPRVHGWAGSA